MPNAYAVLFVQLPDGQEDAWPVTQPVLTLGRSAACHVVLEDRQVSRQHAEIAFGMGPHVQVRDLGSANGTWLNDQALPPRSPVPLRPGDVVRVGPFRLRLAPPQEPLPPALAERVRASSQPQPGLYVQSSGQVAKFPLPADKEVLTLGRASDNDLVIPAPTVSGHHARLERATDGWRIVDLGSTNGLLANGRRVQQQTLRNGDAVSVLDQVWIQYRQSLGLLPADRPTPPPASLVRRIDPTAQPQITIGRSAENDIFLDDPRVSRRHALIERMGARFRLRDLRSDNGTFVNGQRVKDTVWLQPGDEIRVANVRLAFAQDGLQQLESPFGLRLDALHLHKWVSKDKNILQDLSFSILPREFVALVGVSGAGKSTLMDALNGFRPATQGTVLINGKDLYKEYDSFRSELGYVPQDDIMHRELTVGKALDYAAQLRMPADTSPAERQRRVAEVLNELGLADRKDLPIEKLSGGQRKRVSIGIELITKPGLFFLDEATSGLDPGTEAELMRLLRQLADDGRTIVLVTHATKNVMMCDKVIFLAKGGYLAFFGPPEEALGFFDRYRSQDSRLLQPEIDFDDIYRILEDPKLGTPQQWSERYRQSDAFQQYVAERLARTPPAVGQGIQQADKQGRRQAPPKRGVSSLRQWAILSQRYVDVMRNDRKTLLVLLLQAPLIGLTTLVSMGKPSFDRIDGLPSTAMTTLFLMVIIVMLFGTVNTAREITKEAPVYRRERMVNLRIVPYIGSKIFVVTLFVIYQVAVYLAFTLVTTDYPHMSTLVWAQFVLILLMAAMTGALLGLLISAATSSTDQATALIPVILIPQFIFAGVLMPDLANSPASKIATSKWAVEAMATLTEANLAGQEGKLARAEQEAVAALPAGAPDSSVAEARAQARAEALAAWDESWREQFGDVFNVEVSHRFLAMGLIMGVLVLLILLFQKRKDR
jgi:ABC-type multidrug transport system ATPase subunit